MPVSFSNSQLNYFVRVAEAGQISRAARTLYVAQPALSQAIARLERQLGVELLERHPRGVTLTSAGEIFFEKARAALEAEAQAAATARSLARCGSGLIELGFLGSPPPLIAPAILEAFTSAYADVDVSFRELRFPTCSTAEWLADVDLALCYSPTPHEEVEIQPLWSEPRAVLLDRTHRLAARTELSVEDVLDERFYGHHPTVDETWVEFWNLGDHRGGPPLSITSDTPANALELVAAITAGHAISTFPWAVAKTVAGLVPSLAAIPLRDAAPATCSLVWRTPPDNSLTSVFVQTTRELLPPSA
jgi:DNA-binding transcriptional LysR family regulator